MNKNYILTALLASLFSTSSLAATNHCGTQTSIGNPFLCCKAAKGQEAGNCTWFSWKMAKDEWNHELEINVRPRHAKTWAYDRYRAINKSSGYVYSRKPRANSIAIKNSGEYGHVAWVDSLSGSQLFVKEQNCELSQHESGRYRPASFFNDYLLGMRVKDFWVKNIRIKADPNANRWNPNFDAQFKIENVTKNTDYKIKFFTLSVHHSDGSFKEKMYDFNRPQVDANFLPTSVGLYNGNLTGYENNSRTTTTAPVRGSYAFNKPGTYQIVPVILLDNGEWVTVGRYDIEVY